MTEQEILKLAERVLTDEIRQGPDAARTWVIELASAVPRLTSERNAAIAAHEAAVDKLARCTTERETLRMAAEIVASHKYAKKAKRIEP